MIIDLAKLADVIDRTRLDRRLADKIEVERERVDHEIAANGYCDLTLDGQVFRIVRKGRKLIE